MQGKKVKEKHDEKEKKNIRRLIILYICGHCFFIFWVKTEKKN